MLCNPELLTPFCYDGLNLRWVSFILFRVPRWQGRHSGGQITAAAAAATVIFYFSAYIAPYISFELQLTYLLINKKSYELPFELLF